MLHREVDGFLVTTVNCSAMLCQQRLAPSK